MQIIADANNAWYPGVFHCIDNKYQLRTYVVGIYCFIFTGLFSTRLAFFDEFVREKFNTQCGQQDKYIACEEIV